MLRREAEAKLREYLQTFPVVLIVGPRQCGKTTLARHALRGWRFLDLERQPDRDLLEPDIDGFLEVNRDKVAIDEAQRLPGLMEALRAAVDRARRPGRYVLTGSAHPSLILGAPETLAGRIGLLELTPFGLSELGGRSRWAAQRWFWGGYPPLYHLGPHARKSAWLEAYVSTFLERDLPGLGVRVPAARLRRLWAMLAHCHGGLLNAAELARSLDMHNQVVAHYLDLLEGAFAIRRLRPYFANVSKRLTKSPKVYIRDTGLLHWLSGLRRPADLDTWPGRGASWEGFVVEELARLAGLRFPGASVHFWRTQAGAEVDLVVEHGRRKVAVEVKSSLVRGGRSLAALRQCMADLGIRDAFIVYRGRETTALAPGIRLLPWDRTEQALAPLA